jgi:peptidoglycan/LPS O-acetylase OafA/YrhL
VLISKRTSKEQYFRVAVWTMVIVLLVFSPAAFVLFGWFTDAYQDTTQSSEVSHRLHEVVFGVFFTLALVGAITQLLSPKRNLAGLIQTTVTLLTLVIVVTITVHWQVGLLLYLIPLAAVLGLARPARPYREGPVWSWAIALVVIAFFPLRLEIYGHVSRALTTAQNHTTHWSVMAAFALVLLILGVVAALRFTGYRTVAFSIAGAAAVYGVASLRFPFDASSHRTGYAVGLILWAVAWLLAILFLDRPAPDTPRPLTRRVVGWVFLVPVLFVISLIWVVNDDQPNVPHRPDPNHPTARAADVDRATCLGCHMAPGLAGAPIVPHDPERTCEDELCWGGRADCAGCHRIDPDLGGPTEQVEMSRWAGVLVEGPAPRAITSLASDQLELARIVGTEE